MKMKIKIMHSAGYSIVELLIAIALISLLAASSIVLYNGSQQKARDAIREGDMLAIRSGIEQYRTAYEQYPRPDQLSASLFGEFIPTIPKDPRSQMADTETQFGYVYAAAKGADNAVPGQEYELSANFERSDGEGANTRETEDNGGDDARWELGTAVDFVHTNLLPASPTCEDDNEYEHNDGGQGSCILLDALAP